MRLSSPRIEPLDLEQLDEEQAAVLAQLTNPDNLVGGGKVLNIFRTLAHAPKALAAFLGWGSYILSRRNALPEREREMVILRVGWNCRSGYEFAQHTTIGKACGLTDEEITRVKQGPDAEHWTPLESAMLRAADELHSDQFVSDATWSALEEIGDKARMDLVFTVGQYTQVSMMLNSFGIQLEDGDMADPDLSRG